MPIKSWNCPSCHQNFIVDSETDRDTCPWCKAAVEEKAGNLHVVAESAKPKDGAAEAAGGAGSSGTGNNAGNSGNSAGSNNAGGASDGNTGTQSWWPFEYSS